MGAFSFASGFFDRLNSQRDKEEENDLAIQKNMMNVWATTTLPQIRKQRADDDATLSDANGYLQMDQFQKQPELAFYAAKQIRSGRYSDVNDFLSKYNTDPNAVVPPEIRQKQLEALGKTFAYDTDQTTGKVTNFRFQPRKDDSAPIAGSQDKYNGIGDLFMGKRNPANVAEEARTKFKGMTGEDPTNPDAVGSRLNSMPSSGTVSITPVDTRKQRQEDMAYQAALGMLDKSKNASKLLGVLNTGGTAAFMAEISKPGSLYTREDINGMEFQNTMKKTILDGLLSGDFKDSNGAIRALAEGKLTPNVLIPLIKDNLKTPEEKAEVKLDFLKKQGWLNANNEFDVAKILADPKAMEYLAPDPTDRRRLENNLKEIVRSKTMDRALQFAQNVGSAASALVQNVGPKLQTADSEKAPAEQSAAEPPKPNPWGEGERVPGAIGYIPKQEEKPKARLGEDPATGNIDANTTPVMTAVTKADSTAIENTNPFAVVTAVNRLRKNIPDPAKIVNSIRFRPEDEAKLRNAQFRSSYDLDTLVPYMPKYKDEKEAAENAPVGSLAVIRNQYVIVSDAFKKMFSK